MGCDVAPPSPKMISDHQPRSQARLIVESVYQITDPSIGLQTGLINESTFAANPLPRTVIKAQEGIVSHSHTPKRSYRRGTLLY